MQRLEFKKGRGRGYYFVRGYFQMTKDDKFSPHRDSRRTGARETVTLVVGDALTRVTLPDV